MSKAFTKEGDGEDPLTHHSRFQPLPPDFRNLITPAGAKALRDELASLRNMALTQRPEAEAKRLRLQINDLAQRLETQEIAASPGASNRVVFGSTVTVREALGNERRYTLVGIDESSPAQGRISWTSPLGRALLSQEVGNLVTLQTPSGDFEFEVLAVE